MRSLVCLIVFVFSGVLALGNAQDVTAAEVVHYQCKEWKAKHIHDVKKVDTIVATLKKLGVEVKKEKHNGHFDVKYRCPKERHLPVKTHTEAVKWEKWFKEYGFKVYHTH